MTPHVKSKQVSLKGFLEELHLEPKQQEDEEGLRKEVLAAWEDGKQSCRLLGEKLCKLRDDYVGKKRFKRYLRFLKIPRASAYRYIAVWQKLKEHGVPTLIADEAVNEGINPAGKSFIEFIHNNPFPEELNRKTARAYVSAAQLEISKAKAQRSSSTDLQQLSAEEREARSVDFLVNRFEKIRSYMTRLWRNAPAEVRDTEVLRGICNRLATAVGARTLLFQGDKIMRNQEIIGMLTPQVGDWIIRRRCDRGPSQEPGPAYRAKGQI